MEDMARWRGAGQRVWRGGVRMVAEAKSTFSRPTGDDEQACRELSQARRHAGTIRRRHAANHRRPWPRQYVLPARTHAARMQLSQPSTTPSHPIPAMSCNLPGQMCFFFGVTSSSPLHRPVHLGPNPTHSRQPILTTDLQTLHMAGPLLPRRPRPGFI